MIELTNRQRTAVAALAAVCVTAGLAGLWLTGGGSYGTADSGLSVIGYGEYDGPVGLASIAVLGVGLFCGYLVSANTSDEERHGPEI